MSLGQGEVKALQLILSLMVLYMVSAVAVSGEQIYSVDFSKQKDGDARQWLESQGFKFLLDAEQLSLTFEKGVLKIETTDRIAAIVGVDLSGKNSLKNVGNVVIEWGVESFPQGADWESENNRLAIGMLFLLGTEKFSSGMPFGINSAPYFLGPFIGAKEQVDKRYLGVLYQEAGRYYCVANKDSDNPVTTDFEMDRIFKQEFNKKMPPVTAFAFQVNTKDTSGGAKSYIRKITFYSR